MTITIFCKPRIIGAIMSIIATKNDGKIAILSGRRKLLAELEASGSARIILDGTEVVVEFSEQKEVALKSSSGDKKNK